VGRRRPSSNTGYWNPKLDGNQARDQHNRRELLALGWESMTVWECELDSAEQVLHAVTRFLGPASGADGTGTGQQQ
jgi:DNA mismatch endonuclease (patch repair protein)